MNALKTLTNLDKPEKENLGVQYTPGEIAQQPEAWQKTAATVANQSENIKQFIKQAKAGEASPSAYLVGAGTSHFIGESVRHVLAQGWGTAVTPVASTEVVLSPNTLIAPGGRLMVSFARSGQSPEGNAAVQLVRQVRPDVKHLAVTCNAAGELAGLVRGMNEDGYTLLLPPMTNDKGLAMTSSYTSMVVAAQGLANLDSIPEYLEMAAYQAAACNHVIEAYANEAQRLASLGFRRAVFIGSGDLYGVAQESHLKMQEMTAGRVICKAESTLGLRHGPMAAIDAETLVVQFLSADPYVRQYELDLLREMAAQKLGLARIAIADVNHSEIASLVNLTIEMAPEGKPVPDNFKAPVAVVFPQMLALFRSLAEGLRPDAPSPGGVINRVVQGVHIYPYFTEGD